jgi:hypothetical protein
MIESITFYTLNPQKRKENKKHEILHILPNELIKILVGYIITCMLDKLELDNYCVIDINIA